VEGCQEIVAPSALTSPTVGLPGALSAVSTGLVADGVSLRVTIEYGGMTWVPAVPCCALVIEVASSP
jgi:hypothetical protein